MSISALVAAQRFGLGEPDLSRVGSDSRAWLLGQIGPADAQVGDALASSLDALRAHAEFQRARRRIAAEADTRPIEQQFVEHFRAIVDADLRARLATATLTQRPFAERLALFWCNHFTVSMAKASARGLVGSFEREAVRPNIAGSFENLLQAAVHHAAMLRYLDNEVSAGPNSRYVQRRAARADGGPRITGLNENLAREVLELHTLGVAGGGAEFGGWGGYSQADVIGFAAVLTGWRTPVAEILAGRTTDSVRFDPAWHEPGPKTVLGRTYPEGPLALNMVLHDLAHHPSTARFVSAKLARHFVADDPPPALVARLAAAYDQSGGDLPTLYRLLVDAPEAAAARWPKLKTPEEFVLGSLRLLGLGQVAFARRPDAGITTLGQRIQAAPSPAGWPDRAEDWLGPDAVWKRIEWATRLGALAGQQVDARALARSALGADLSAGSASQIERAADGPQALALLLLTPEMQRR